MTLPTREQPTLRAMISAIPRNCSTTTCRGLKRTSAKNASRTKMSSTLVAANKTIPMPTVVRMLMRAQLPAFRVVWPREVRFSPTAFDRIQKLRVTRSCDSFDPARSLEARLRRRRHDVRPLSRDRRLLDLAEVDLAFHD